MAEPDPDSPQLPQIARQVVEIVGPLIDMGRLKSILEGAFGARSVKLRATVPLEIQQPRGARSSGSLVSASWPLLLTASPGERNT